MPEVQSPALSKIIKRLELIKNLISLEEVDEINSHISKLVQLTTTPELDNIIIFLREKCYSKAIIAIEAFINRHNTVAIYADPEIETLKFEVKSLEAEITNLSSEKADFEKLIHEFGVRHNNELGELIIKILNFRKEKSKGTLQQEEAEKDFEDFSNNYEASKKETIASLTEEEVRELKDKYRKCSKLCHPDVVGEGQKEIAHSIFMELKTAYESNDLQKVTEILKKIQQSDAFTNIESTVNEKSSLKAKIQSLRQRIYELEAAIISVKNSDTYKTILRINNWDEYFSEIKQQLQEQLIKSANGCK